MRRSHILLATGLALLFSIASASRAAAQSPDLREILPYLMLVVDTSGSMERLPSCTCTTPSCDECLPNCALADNSTNRKKNRWASTLEALTGTFQSFECETVSRTSQSGLFTYDLGYYLPYNQPWDCSGYAPGVPCTFDAENAGTPISTRVQSDDGIIDTYGARVRFGLMTFDGWDTYVGAPPLVSVNDFNYTISNAVQGLWSYGGTTSSGAPRVRASGHRVGSFHYPNCPTDYLMDTGVRSAAAMSATGQAEGTLVSLSSCSSGELGSPTCPEWCGACPATQQSINRDIQEALLATRPYGGTPIAASLDDLYWHLKEDTSDSFGACRNRFALLITDGYPDDDYRSFGCDCAADIATNPLACGDPTLNDPAQMHCPYPTAEEAAAALVQGTTSEPALLQRLFVVGLAVDDPGVVARLDDIADAGCTGDPLGECLADPNATPPNNHQVFFANNVPTLVSSLSSVIDQLIDPISRSVPTYALGTSNNRAQFQFSTGFEIPIAQNDPWSGIIERRRYNCAAEPPAFDVINAGSGDLFHERLDAQATRDLWTAFPTGSTTIELEGVITRQSGSCGTNGCARRDLNSTVVTNAMLGVLSDTERNYTLNWMYGYGGPSDAGGTNVRSDKRLGAIYHSSPVIVASPQFDTSDEAFNRFRQRPAVRMRPPVLYVGSNDGILHAFSVDDFTAQTGGDYPSFRNLVAGEELWGFVPPMYLDDLPANRDTNQPLMDATPVVKNVYLNRTRGVDGTGEEYRTVLISGMRDGGNGYIALDVTNPFEPSFLWQVSDPQMGKTYGQPAIVQATFQRMVNSSLVTKNGAIAILPGGVGEVTASDATVCSNGSTSSSMRRPNTSPFDTYGEPDVYSNVHGHRYEVRCWRATGRALYFVDVEDGALIKKIYLSNPQSVASESNLPVFPSPLVSSISAFPNEIGVLATRAFITDADGVVWRIDLRATDPVPNDPMAGWTARPFHDLFWDRGPSQGELSYEAPMLSVDEQGRPVVIVGTGDNNDFVKPTVQNRIVSLTEVVDPALAGLPPSTPSDYRAAFNWEERVKSGTFSTTRSDGSLISVDGFVDSELVTGSMGLYEGTLYFGTFIAVSGSSDVCDMGKGRVHAVSYRERDTVDANGSNPPTYGPKRVSVGSDAETNSVVNVLASAALENVMVMGLGITQRPTCNVIDTNFDPYTGGVPAFTSLTDPAIYLVAQASGDKGGVIEDRGGSRLGSIELNLKRPMRLAKVTSWATSVD